MEKITAREFVEKVEQLEGITFSLWTDPKTEVDDYNYKKKIAGNSTIADWIDGRIKSKIGDIPVRIIDGKHATPHRGQKMDTLRSSYDPT